MQNYKYVLEYDQEAHIDSSQIHEALYHAWKVTPSKQNFMPYKVHVLSPKAKIHKQILYNKALKQQAEGSGVKIKNAKALQKYDEFLRKNNRKPFFRNLKTASYVFIFSQRVEDQPNPYQLESMALGMEYSQLSKEDPEHGHSEEIARIEIGMFSANLATKLLENNIDISFTQCFSGDIETWTEKEFDFLDDNVLLIMTAGKGKLYRRDIKSQELDVKPEFERIISKEV